MEFRDLLLRSPSTTDAPKQYSDAATPFASAIAHEVTRKMSSRSATIEEGHSLPLNPATSIQSSNSSLTIACLARAYVFDRSGFGMLDLHSWNYECVCGGKHLTRRTEDLNGSTEKPECEFCAAELPRRFAGCNLFYTPVEAPPQGEF
jgi:hypothetical protein